MRLVLCYPVEAKHLAQIARVAPRAEIVDAGQDRIAEEIHRCDLFCGHAKVPVDWDRVVAGGRLVCARPSVTKHNVRSDGTTAAASNFFISVLLQGPVREQRRCQQAAFNRRAEPGWPTPIPPAAARG